MSNWHNYLNDTVKNIPPSGIRRFFSLAAEMEGVISLGVGEPDFVTPWHIREACVYSLEKGHTTYTANQGLLALRKAVGKHLSQTYQVDYNPQDQLLITVGVSEGLDLALRVIVQPGDEVLIPEPCYVSYVPGVILAGGVPVSISAKPE
ncbi:aminotransferase class I/II-fold pyridoxal phosphate-dependent enzyme, partial [Peptococcaceae bacterium]|nr:aminotransferase class I/II-fold pyridoxal phosphate-dependent enzyme [Peptococcaceae bacterium]